MPRPGLWAIAGSRHRSMVLRAFWQCSRYRSPSRIGRFWSGCGDRRKSMNVQFQRRFSLLDVESRKRQFQFSCVHFASPQRVRRIVDAYPADGELMAGIRPDRVWVDLAHATAFARMPPWVPSPPRVTVSRTCRRLSRAAVASAYLGPVARANSPTLRNEGGAVRTCGLKLARLTPPGESRSACPCGPATFARGTREPLGVVFS